MAGFGDTTRIGDAVKVGIVDKPKRELGVNEYLLNDDELAKLHRGVSIHLILEDGYQLWLKHA